MRRIAGALQRHVGRDTAGQRGGGAGDRRGDAGDEIGHRVKGTRHRSAGDPFFILAPMLVVLVAFAAPFALALGASRLRSVAGLTALAIAAYAGSAADPRTAVLAAVPAAALALLSADALRLRRRRLPVVRLAPEDRRRPVELLAEHHPRELVRQRQRA